MTTYEEIESAIDTLPRERFFQLVGRLRQKYGDEWDRQMEEDAQPGGPLDHISEEALSEHGS